ncbi:MAG: hypothetical protein AAF728_17550, partial [Cyanobacteria bacterium P01_D01_bin.128]
MGVNAALTAAYTLQTQAQPAEPNLSLREQLQLALAVADGAKLRSLLTESHPPIAPGAQIGTVTANISVPAAGITVDGVVRYELVHCILAQMLQFSDPHQCQNAVHQLVAHHPVYGNACSRNADIGGDRTNLSARRNR